MKVLGIIAEYNPFHNGHIYHINEAKEITNSDYTILIMSGPFTQSGNISIMDKYKKAELAIKYGIDLVIELPQIYAISSAYYFAKYSIKLLDSLNIVDFICFGSECDDINMLNKISNKINENQNLIWESIKKEEKNLSFASSREEVLESILNKDEIKVLKGSNDILGLEYINELNKLKSKIKPFTIKRNEKFKSATYIRDNIKGNIKDYLPNESYNYIRTNTPNIENLYTLIRYKILNEDLDTLSSIKDIKEGLENKLKKEIINSTSYDELIHNIKSKRYQMSTIKRILINTLLNITKKDFDFAIKNDILYAHVLKCNDNGKKLLSEISKKSNINVITSMNKNNTLPQNIQRYIDIDIKAQNIYDIILDNKINNDYTNKI